MVDPQSNDDFVGIDLNQPNEPQQIVEETKIAPPQAAAANPYAAQMEQPQANPSGLQLLEQTQTEQLRTMMVTLVTNNQFNAYCIDCQQRQSSHANIAYGTFICEVCAQVHLMYFGMHKHYIKEIFSELWDPHQLNVVQRFGNKKFFDHLQKIRLVGHQDLVQKYNHPGVKKYKKELIATIMNKPKPKSSTNPHGAPVMASSTSKTT